MWSQCVAFSLLVVFSYFSVVPSSSTTLAADTLLAVWQQSFATPPLPFAFAELDITTALPGTILYSNSSLESLFGGQCAYDATKKILYLQVFGTSDASIVGFDLNDLNKIQLVYLFSITFQEFVIHLDPSTNRLFLAGGNPTASVESPQFQGIEVGYIDLTSNKYTQLTILPDNLWFLTVSGSASTIDFQSRLLILSIQNAIADPPLYYTATVNIDTGATKLFSQTTYLVQTIVTTPYGIQAIIGNLSSTSGPLAVALLDPLTASLKPQTPWSDSTLSFIVSGQSVYSPTNNLIYTIASNGVSPPASLVVASAINKDGTGGILVHTKTFPSTSGTYTQPRFIQLL